MMQPSMPQQFLPLFALLLTLGSVDTTYVSAQDTGTDHSARHHFRLGFAHYESGAFRQAATEFEAAYELSQRPELQHNIYVAYRDANDFRRAADALRRYLELLPNAEDATVLRGRLQALDATIANGDAGPDATPRATDAASGAPQDVSPSSGGGEQLSPVGFIVAGSGLALLGVSLATGLLAASASDELASVCPDRSCPSGYDHESIASEGVVLALTTDVLLGVGGAFLITGSLLAAVLREGDDLQAGASCSSQGCFGALRGRF